MTLRPVHCERYQSRDAALRRSQDSAGAGPSFRRGGEIKNIFEILQQKEAQMIRVRCELECLRLILPLLAEPGDEEPGDEIANVPTQPEVEKWFAGEKEFP